MILKIIFGVLGIIFLTLGFTLCETNCINFILDSYIVDLNILGNLMFKNEISTSIRRKNHRSTYWQGIFILIGGICFLWNTPAMSKTLIIYLTGLGNGIAFTGVLIRMIMSKELDCTPANMAKIFKYYKEEIYIQRNEMLEYKRINIELKKDKRRMTKFVIIQLLLSVLVPFMPL